VELETRDDASAGFRRRRREGCSGTCFFLEREREREINIARATLSREKKIPRPESLKERKEDRKKGRPKLKKIENLSSKSPRVRSLANAKSVLSNVHSRVFVSLFARARERERERPSPRSLFSSGFAREFTSPRTTKKKQKRSIRPESSQNAQNATERAKRNDAKFKRDKFLL